MKKNHISLELIPLLGIMLLFSACAREGTAFSPTTTPLTAVSTNTRLPTDSLPPTATLTWTPIPTLPPHQVEETVRGLYENNGGCELPCWWGITPSETGLQEGFQILSPLGLVHGPFLRAAIAHYEFKYPVPRELDPSGVFQGIFTPGIYVKGGTIIAININAGWVSRNFDYSLAGILKAYGSPDEIWLKLTPESMDQPRYTIELFYGGKGMEFSANGMATVQGNIFTVCPQDFRLDIYPPGVLLWHPSDEITFKNRGEVLAGGGILSTEFEDYLLLDDISNNFSTRLFYETYLDPHSTTCYEIDLSKLP
jgi:hypothetical protein